MEMIQSLETYQLILFIALGLAVLFFGYRIKKVAFFIIWFLLGFNLTVWLMPTLNQMVPQIANDAILSEFDTDWWRRYSSDAWIFD